MSEDAYEIIEFPDRDTWLAARRLGIGSSDASAVLGISPFKDHNPQRVFAEKIGVPVAKEATEAMNWGNILEGPVADEYARRTQRRLRDPGRHRVLRSRKYPWMTATLDREIIEIPDVPVMLGNELVKPEDLRKMGPGIYEGKTTGYVTAEEWVDEPPPHVQVQVQHQLAVTDWAWASIAVLIRGQELLYFDVLRNPEFIAILIEREAEFWDRVQRQEPPDFEDIEAETAVFKHRFPREITGKTVDLDEEAVQVDISRQEAVAQIEAWKLRKDQADLWLRTHIGDAEYGRLPSGIGYSLKVVNKAAYTVKPQQYRELRRKAK